MYTVKSAMAHLTDPNVILQNVCSTLRKIDPQFVKQEQKYHTAVQSEFSTLLTRKKEMYPAYRKLRDEMKALLTAKANVDRLLDIENVQKSSSQEKIL